VAIDSGGGCKKKEPLRAGSIFIAMGTDPILLGPQGEQPAVSGLEQL